jgi:uncharacterized small protein (TIGR04563 family)
VPAPKKKVTLYFTSGLLEETQREAIRQDRSISWIIQSAWRMARDEVRKLPGATASAPLPAAAAAPPPPPPGSAVVPLSAAPKPRGG